MMTDQEGGVPMHEDEEYLNQLRRLRSDLARAFDCGSEGDVRDLADRACHMARLLSPNAERAKWIALADLDRAHVARVFDSDVTLAHRVVDDLEANGYPYEALRLHAVLVLADALTFEGRARDAVAMLSPMIADLRAGASDPQTAQPKYLAEMLHERGRGFLALQDARGARGDYEACLALLDSEHVVAFAQAQMDGKAPTAQRRATWLRTRATSGLALALAAAGDLDEALTRARDAVAVEATYEERLWGARLEATAALGAILVKAGKATEALSECSDAIDQDTHRKFVVERRHVLQVALQAAKAANDPSALSSTERRLNWVTNFLPPAARVVTTQTTWLLQGR